MDGACKPLPENLLSSAISHGNRSRAGWIRGREERRKWIVEGWGLKGENEMEQVSDGSRCRKKKKKLDMKRSRRGC